MQAIRAHLGIEGPDADQAAFLLEQWTTRCPIYTTYIRATDITITQELVEAPITMPGSHRPLTGASRHDSFW